MNSSSLLRATAVLATLALVNPARAQTLEIGAQEFLFEPGSISATLLAAPTMTMPNFWDTAIFYQTESAVGLFQSTLNNVVGSTVTTPTMQVQTAPLFISTFFGTAPTGEGQGDAIGTFTSTGFTDASNKPGGLPPIANAVVIFGADHTAQVGFAPSTSPLPTDFNDFPLRISLTNVSSADVLSPVPEPSTWILMLIGLLATLMWRRRVR